MISNGGRALPVQICLFAETERMFNEVTISYIFVLIHGPPSHAATGSSERCLWPIELTLLGNAEQRDQNWETSAGLCLW